MTDEDKQGQEALLTLIRTGWGQDNPAFRQMFSTMFIPSASAELMDSFNEMMRVATAPDVAARIMDVCARMDVTRLLSQVQAPTLILHGSGDAVQPIQEGRRLAASIPNSQMIELDTSNHMTVHTEPAMQIVVDEVERFVAEHASPLS
jgi:pimeloyl-ACP methyl ester carboxylesterase